MKLIIEWTSREVSKYLTSPSQILFSLSVCFICIRKRECFHWISGMIHGLKKKRFIVYNFSCTETSPHTGTSTLGKSTYKFLSLTVLKELFTSTNLLNPLTVTTLVYLEHFVRCRILHQGEYLEPKFSKGRTLPPSLEIDTPINEGQRFVELEVSYIRQK